MVLVPGTKDEWVGPRRSRTARRGRRIRRRRSRTSARCRSRTRACGHRDGQRGHGPPERLRLRSGLGPAAQRHRLRALPERWLRDQVRRARDRAPSGRGGRPAASRSRIRSSKAAAARDAGSRTGLAGRRQSPVLADQRLPTGLGCVEDIVLATFGQADRRLHRADRPPRRGQRRLERDPEDRGRSGERPAGPRHRPQPEVAGQGVRGVGRRHRWRSRDLLPGSENATYAIVDTNGDRRRDRARRPGRLGVRLLLGLAARGSRRSARPRSPFGLHHRPRCLGAAGAVPDATEFAGISRSPFGDGRYAVLADGCRRPTSRGPSRQIVDPAASTACRCGELRSPAAS